ncbi:MAG: tetratricopeptide repeat protein, partial [Phenylobacterium sp.]
AIQTWLTVQGTVAVSVEDWPQVIALAAQSDALRDDGGQPAGAPRTTAAGAIWPVVWRPYALAATGRQAEADAAAATLPLDCYSCLIVRAKVADAKGDNASAERWLAEAVRQGPSIPAAYAELATLNLARGDADRALAYARAGNKASPRAAEPLEAWAEALLAKGNARAAAARFAEAAKLAPRWGRLHLKWGEALAKLGKADEARVKWRAAATMDLSPADRAALKAHGV